MKFRFGGEEGRWNGSPQSPWEGWSSPSSGDPASPLTAFSAMSLTSILSPKSTLTPPWLQGQRELGSEDRGLWLIKLLLACANCVSAGHMENTNLCLEQLSLLASPTGDPMQRVATYFMEALAARITKAWPGLHKALNCTHLPPPVDRFSVRQMLFNLCPFLKVSYAAVNHSIMEAMEGEDFVHIIDLNDCEPIQWAWLMHSLAARNGGPPNLRITAVSEHRQALDRTARVLAEEADKLNIPFQFHPVHSTLDHLEAEELKVKIGEAVAISSVLQLHTLLAEEENDPTRPQKRPGWPPVRSGPRFQNTTLDDLLKSEPRSNLPSPSQIEEAIVRKAAAAAAAAGSPRCPRIDRFLDMLRGRSPKIMVVVEQDSNHNGALFMERFVEAMHYYGAVFDSLASDGSQQRSMERLAVEKYLFGEEIKDIVACEGGERKERHEKLDKWLRRMEGAGFVRVPVSYETVLQAKGLINDAYRLGGDHGCLVLGWQEMSLFSISAWRSS
ncbi:hypothetical protein SUGI_1148960 [Cryptomeria japonica]|uniref:scarecrow-like protein 3 n=1 Tax=Cryptomeria japonica TaxID=3369 RepID=UPI00241479A0|nr:scarecrow-like protein 3 [Cryptomeria japonica]XP_057849866.2 scarecrow-like protein 3 [Cryptomeria japonica]GLJ53827.1 hypothetical protein SUGI_1148960 [Cryptomeria japonica]